MRHILTILLATFLTAFAALAELKPTEVAVVYNGDSELSREMMERYCQARHIPQDQVFALYGLSEKDITRGDFEIMVRADLIMQARGRGISWSPGPRYGKKTMRAIALMPDLPLRVKEDPSQPAGKIGPTPGNSASLDAELMLLGANFPIAGPLHNPCYKASPASLGANTQVMAVTRIDGPDKECILRLVDDPVKVEATGLWGWVVVDQGGPYKDGDAWMENIAKMALARHQPLFHETSKATLADTFPLMPDTIVYFGWYANPANGPFRAEAAGGFRFTPGAVAIHLHSYSGTSIKSKRTWVGALLYRGAAVTAGNVAEPTLGGCINFEIFYKTLLEGGSVGEAQLLSTPYLSWQNVVIGDPLYRPFPAKPARRPAADNPFVKWQELHARYEKDPKGFRKAVDALLGGKHGGVYAEMLAWHFAETDDYKQAVNYFRQAGSLYKEYRDQTRAVLLQLTCMPAAGQKADAQRAAREWRESCTNSVYAPAIIRTADVIDPPEPKDGKKKKK